MSCLVLMPFVVPGECPLRQSSELHPELAIGAFDRRGSALSDRLVREREKRVRVNIQNAQLGQYDFRDIPSFTLVVGISRASKESSSPYHKPDYLIGCDAPRPPTLPVFP